MSHKTMVHIDDFRGKELTYSIVLTEALNALFADKRHPKPNQQKNHDRLLEIKNLLDDIFLLHQKKKSNEYRILLFKKILVEKLILNIISGNKNDIKQNIAQLLKEEDVIFINQREGLISPEDRFLIKTDFNGLANAPAREQLSPFFQKVIKYKNCSNSNDKYSPEMYDLEKIPAWQSMKQFASFEGHASHLKSALSHMQINPKRLRKLNAFDLVVLLKNYHIINDIPSFESQKSKFVKFFIKNYEREFRDYLLQNKDLIVFSLSCKGIRIDEKKNSDAYKNFVDKAIQNMKKKGQVPPLFNIHHKGAVKDCGDTVLSDCNKYSNLCLMLEVPYHHIFHLFDHKDKRLILPDNIIFWGGLTKFNQFFFKQEDNSLKALYSLTHGKRKGR